jgi:hypothetical protein
MRSMNGSAFAPGTGTMKGILCFIKAGDEMCLRAALSAAASCRPRPSASDTGFDFLVGLDEPVA